MMFVLEASLQKRQAGSDTSAIPIADCYSVYYTSEYCHIGQHSPRRPSVQDLDWQNWRGQRVRNLVGCLIFTFTAGSGSPKNTLRRTENNFNHARATRRRKLFHPHGGPINVLVGLRGIGLIALVVRWWQVWGWL
eukprot:6182877-Pleurochrysis_carterae.AAC.1